MSELIPPERLPEWVPGRVLLDSKDLNWRRVSLRAYEYPGQDVIVPAMRDFMLVGYQRGSTPMQRRFEGRWKRDRLGPGATSLLTRAQQAHWNWVEPIEVTHVYLSPTLVAEVASEAMERHVSEVRLADVLRTEDPVMAHCMAAIAEEARQGGLGGALYVESMARALIVHLLRRYASISMKPARSAAELSPEQRRKIVDYVEENLSEPLDLAEMGSVLGLPPCLFAKLFRQSFGRPPYADVVSRRLARAEKLLATSELAIKEIAALCGFSDQAHLTRLFARAHGVPPAAWRKRAKG